MIYLDNAATTQIDPQVVDAMNDVLINSYGNPSSIHALGRKSRSLIEQSRKQISNYFGVSPGSIFFTSGGTEADNMAVWQSVKDLGVKRIITSPTEHHAVLHTVEMLHSREEIILEEVRVCNKGKIQMDHLEELLSSSKVKTLVSLMHANNEIATMIDLKAIGQLCKEHEAYFHSDTVQTVGHFEIDPREYNLDFFTCSAHKLHGPKGIGFLYINDEIRINPLIYGGAQERNMRGGTENIYGIVGLAKALSIAYENLEEHSTHIRALKNRMIQGLKDKIGDVSFNGDTSDNSLYTVLNVCLPDSPNKEMLIYSLDIAGICASSGSACSSGSNVGSHVLKAIGSKPERPSVRFSFSKYNTEAEIDLVVEKLAELI
ncbi:MAG: cysteine desulfurase [Flavobacteriales bacterium]|nr:cysteine desulfurase [Flavobacteriales bacterium]